MPLPIDDDHIVAIERKGKIEFATPEDSIKFLKLIGETVFGLVNEEENIRMGMLSLSGESCEECGFIDCICDDLDENIDEWDRDDS